MKRIKTWDDFEAATLQERLQWERECRVLCERARQRELQDDMQADRRAFEI